MIATEAQTRSARAGEHLQLMQLLGCELDRAMQAIVANDIRQLEDSIANQQELGSRLGELARSLGAQRQSVGPTLPDEIDEDLRRKIRDAAGDLQNLNLRYSLLLQHSSRSVAQMVSLFRSFRDQSEEVSGARPKYQTWSCRM